MKLVLPAPFFPKTATKRERLLTSSSFIHLKFLTAIYSIFWLIFSSN
nr:MAG TPA: hypothetical protein [Caudoviricetes sp.]DAQ94265.1 MAG TPA: hypothetical protein [Caudoviricetes sp.]